MIWIEVWYLIEHYDDDANGGVWQWQWWLEVAAWKVVGGGSFDWWVGASCEEGGIKKRVLSNDFFLKKLLWKLILKEYDFYFD